MEGGKFGNTSGLRCYKTKRPFRVQRGMKRKEKRQHLGLFGDLCSWAGCICDWLFRHTYIFQQTWKAALFFQISGQKLGLELKTMEPPPNIPHFDSSSFLEPAQENQTGTNKLTLGIRTPSSPNLENPGETMGSAGGMLFMGNRNPKPREHSRIRWATAAAFPWLCLSIIPREKCPPGCPQHGPDEPIS